MADQLALPIGPAYDRLCGLLRITPAVEGEDESLRSTWVKTGENAWEVLPHSKEGWIWHTTAPNYSYGATGYASSRDEAAVAAVTRLEGQEERRLRMLEQDRRRRRFEREWSRRRDR